VVAEAVDTYGPALATLSDEVDDLDLSTQRITRVSRRVLELRRAMVPLVEFLDDLGGHDALALADRTEITDVEQWDDAEHPLDVAGDGDLGQQRVLRGEPGRAVVARGGGRVGGDRCGAGGAAGQHDPQEGLAVQQERLVGRVAAHLVDVGQAMRPRPGATELEHHPVEVLVMPGADRPQQPVDRYTMRFAPRRGGRSPRFGFGGKVRDAPPERPAADPRPASVVAGTASGAVPAGAADPAGGGAALSELPPALNVATAAAAATAAQVRRYMVPSSVLLPLTVGAATAP
jgi:hypothetical protein